MRQPSACNSYCGVPIRSATPLSEPPPPAPPPPRIALSREETITTADRVIVAAKKHGMQTPAYLSQMLGVLSLGAPDREHARRVADLRVALDLPASASDGDTIGAIRDLLAALERAAR